MGSFGVLGLGLFGVGVDKCWNFNGCGSFCGEIFGGGGCIGWVVGSGSKPSQGLILVGLVVVGRG